MQLIIKDIYNDLSESVDGTVVAVSRRVQL